VIGAFLPEEDPFVVKLPTNWNGNYFQVGNGGLAGSIDPASVNFGLVRGYAAASASGGYDVTGDQSNGKFGIVSNPYAEEKLDGYCFSSVHKMNVLAKRIIKIY
jgi:feruloyl esterase